MQTPTAHRLQLSETTLDVADPGGTLADIARLAYCGTAPEHAMAGIRRILTRTGPLCLAVPDEAIWPVDGLAGGASAGDAAGWLGGLLLARPGPFSRAVLDICRCAPWIEPDPGCPEGRIRQATGAEQAELLAWDEPEMWEREGTMRAGKLTIGPTRLRLLTGRIEPGWLARIRGGEPAGAVLGPYGMVRAHRKAEVCWPDDPVVRSSARLARDGRLIGFADEQPSMMFAEYLAKAATR